MTNPRTPRDTEPSGRTLTLIAGGRQSGTVPPPPDPALAEAFAVISEEAHERGWNECLAYVLRGDLRPRRPRPPRSGPRPDLAVIRGES